MDDYCQGGRYEVEKSGNVTADPKRFISIVQKSIVSCASFLCCGTLQKSHDFRLASYVGDESVSFVIFGQFFSGWMELLVVSITNNLVVRKSHHVCCN